MEVQVEIADTHQQKWDQRFLDLAKMAASWSKDPSTQTGAVLVDPWNRVLSLGFNGFPQRIADDERLQDRAMKYEIIVHCEVNAMLFSCSNVAGGTPYTWPFMSCSRCAAIMIQAGIRRHVAPRSNQPRWAKSFELSMQV
jgi:dCMP deaminase